MEKEYKILKNNFLLLNSKNNENEKNINLMKNKEIKLMQVLYLMKEKGININSFLTQVNHITFVQKNEKENFKENSYNNRLIIKSIRDDESQNETEMSGITVYFPDKIRMNNIMETNWGKNIPKLNFELVPKYFINYFCKKPKSFIEKIKEINEKKEENTNILLGPYIQILLLFYTSRNPYLNQYYNNEKNKNEKEIKDKFIYLIKPKFERKFDDNYEYTEDEIFSNNNDSIDTFDGNDINNNSKIKYDSFKTIINNYFEKINQINNNSNNKMSDQNSNQNQATKTDKNITEKNIGENTTLEESKTVEQSDNSGENVPGISAKTTFRFK